jgi:AraC-like DNA-binding protein
LSQDTPSRALRAVAGGNPRLIRTARSRVFRARDRRTYGYDQDWREERKRLRGMEELWDPGTKANIEALGIGVTRLHAVAAALAGRRRLGCPIIKIANWQHMNDDRGVSFMTMTSSDTPTSCKPRASVLIRVEDEPPATRLEYFRRALAPTIALYDVRMEADGAVRASIRTGRVGTVGVTNVSFPPGPRLRFDARRTPRLIRRSDPELFKIHVQVRGSTAFEQGGREAVLRPGDFTFLDLSRPSHVRHVGDEHEVVAVQFRPAALPLRHDEVARVTAVRVPGDDGLGAPIAALARHLARRLGDHGATDGARLSTALTDLLIVALAERLDRGAAVPPATRHRALLASAQSLIDRRLADPRLSPSEVATAHHISLRSLQKLFEDQGTSVARWIRERRLERCRRDLLDPALSDLPASIIALGWGFVDAAHFSRVFREAYGHPPGEYRRLGGEQQWA